MAKKRPAEGASEDWITTFGDLMSLMLCFFLLLYTIAMQKDGESDMQKVLEEIRTGFNDTIKKVEKQEAPPVVDVEKQEIAKKIEDIIVEKKLEDFVHVVIEEKKIKIILKQPVVFRSGSARLKKSFKSVLGDIGGVIKTIPHPIFIEGHTDNVPIRTKKYESNWQLSFARTYSIIKYLQKVEKIPPSRLSGTGYGEYRPLVPNDSKENRAKNRRIELNILFLKTSDGNNESSAQP